MRDSFFAEVILRDVPGGEAKWVARLVVGGQRRESKPEAIRADAEAWLVRQIRVFLAEPVVIAAPDGDGVIVRPMLEDRVVFSAPSVAVHVGRLSPMAAMPIEAARIAERLYYAGRLLEEAAQLAASVGGVAIGESDIEGSLWGLEERVETTLEWLGCSVFGQAPVAPVGGVETTPVPHLTVVADAAHGPRGVA